MISGNRTMKKLLFRTIRHSLGRFFAIMAIIALGVGLYAGLTITRPAMLITGKEYFDDRQFYDYRLISTLGLTAEDVEVFQNLEGVSRAEGSVSSDLLIRENGNDRVVRMMSLTQEVNLPVLAAGRMPEAPDEILADAQDFPEDTIGTTLLISPENKDSALDLCIFDEYTIVGLAESPLYISFERGTTSLGNGTVSGFIYIPNEGLDCEVFTEIYVRLAEQAELYTDEADAICDRFEPVLTDTLEARADLRYEKLYREGSDELEDAKVELADGENELADALAELNDGETEYSDGLAELEDARDELNRGEADYQSGLRELEDNRATLADAEKKLEEGTAELSKKRSELDSSRTQVNDGLAQTADTKAILTEALKQLEEAEAILAQKQTELDAAQTTLAQKQAEIDAAQTTLVEKQAEIDAAQTTLAQSKAELDQAEAALALLAGTVESMKADPSADPVMLAGMETMLAENQEKYNAGKALYEEAIGELAAGKAEIDAAKEQLATGQAEIDAARIQLDAGKAELAAGTGELAENRLALEGGLAECASAESQLQESFAQIEEGEAALAEGEAVLAASREELEDGKAAFAEGEATLADARATLDDGWSELADGENELADARTKLDDGWSEYRSGLDELEDARIKIEDAEKELDDFARPDLYTLGRDTNIGYLSFDNDTAIVEAVSDVFPIFFFMVASLVCITTMTRMVEEERTQIGILKALGYSSASIMSNYLLYAILASLAGCIGGFFGGSRIFPLVIWKVYGIMYDLPRFPIHYTVDWNMAIWSVSLYLFCALLATWSSCRSELKEVAAELIRPKSPKPGKRILLERITPLWKRMKFLHKVSFRNVFRYKKRLGMMVLGISGCMALLITGFGLNDSITLIVEHQYEEISLFDMSTTLKNEVNDETREEILSIVPRSIFFHESTLDISSESDLKSTHFLVCGPEITDYMVLASKDKLPCPYPEKGEIAISEGLAESLDVSVGDSVRLTDSDHRTMDLTVSGLFTNYIYNYALVSPETCINEWGNTPEVRTVYSYAPENADLHETGAALMNLDPVSSVSINQDMRDRVGSILKNMDAIIVLILFCAGALAFIVLYNLTNINLGERIREIATLKVLGFRAGETSSYVFRENIILTLIGMAAGIPLGILLHRFVISKVRIDMMTFAPRINWPSYIYSCALCLCFALIVSWFMRLRIRRINMAESLKSAE